MSRGSVFYQSAVEAVTFQTANLEAIILYAEFRYCTSVSGTLEMSMS